MHINVVLHWDSLGIPAAIADDDADLIAVRPHPNTMVRVARAREASDMMGDETRPASLHNLL
jgi:sporulation-control protein spo0M